jgi:hypothetical protein
MSSRGADKMVTYTRGRGWIHIILSFGAHTDSVLGSWSGSYTCFIFLYIFLKKLNETLASTSTVAYTNTYCNIIVNLYCIHLRGCLEQVENSLSSGCTSDDEYVIFFSLSKKCDFVVYLSQIFAIVFTMN